MAGLHRYRRLYWYSLHRYNTVVNENFLIMVFLWYNPNNIIRHDLGHLLRYTVYTLLTKCTSGPQHALQFTTDLRNMIDKANSAVRMCGIVFIALLRNEIVYTDWRCGQNIYCLA